MQRWALKLTQFNYDFEYCKGAENVKCDCLSRLPLPITCTKTVPYEMIFSIETINSSIVTCETIRREINKDPDLVQLKQFIITGCPERIVNSVLSKFKSLIPQMILLKGCIMFQNIIFDPAILGTILHSISHFHDSDLGITAMKALVRSPIWYPGLDKDIESLVKSCKICQSVRSKPAQNTNISWPVPSRAWSRIHVNHFFIENNVCLIVVDAVSKYIECEIVASTSVRETIVALYVILRAMDFLMYCALITPLPLLGTNIKCSCLTMKSNI